MVILAVGMGKTSDSTPIDVLWHVITRCAIEHLSHLRDFTNTKKAHGVIHDAPILQRGFHPLDTACYLRYSLRIKSLVAIGIFPRRLARHRIRQIRRAIHKHLRHCALYKQLLDDVLCGDQKISNHL